MACIGLNAQTDSEQHVSKHWNGKGFFYPDQYQVALERCQNGVKSCDIFIKAFEDRAQIERDYIATIHNWSKTWQREINDSQEFGTNKKTWLGVIRASEEIASTRKNLVDRIQHDVIDQMIVFKRQQYPKSVIHIKKIKDFEKEFEDIQKPWLKLLSKINAAKEAYYEKQRKFIAAEKAKRIILSNKGASDEERIGVEETIKKYAQESAVLRTKYEQLIEDMTNRRPNYEASMKQVLERTHDCERERLSKCKELFIAFHNAVQIRDDPNLNKMSAAFQSAIEAHNIEADIQWWNNNFGSDSNTRWPKFEDLSD